MEEVEPGAGDGAAVDFLKSGAVKGKLGSVNLGSLWEFFGGDFVGFEVEEPDFFGLNEGKVDGALDNHRHVVDGGVVCDVKADLSEFAAGELSGEFKFAAQAARVLIADLGSGFGRPEFDNSAELNCFRIAGLETVLGKEGLNSGAGAFDADRLVWGEELQDAMPGLPASLSGFLLAIFGF